MKSNRGRKGGGGSKDLGAGLKYSSRPEVGEGAGRRGGQDALRPTAARPAGEEGRGLRGRRRGQGARVWPGAGRPRGRPGPRRAALCLGPGTAPLPLSGRGAGPTGGISCLAGAWPEDLWYPSCCAPASEEAGRLRFLEMPISKEKRGPPRTLRGLRTISTSRNNRGRRLGVGDVGGRKEVSRGLWSRSLPWALQEFVFSLLTRDILCRGHLGD